MTTPRSILLALPLVLSAAFTPAMAASPRKVVVDQERLATLPVADQQRVLCIAERLETITALDRNTLTRADRKALRTEVNSLRTEANAYNRAAGGSVIIISSAGLIIILLLLIILL